RRRDGGDRHGGLRGPAGAAGATSALAGCASGRDGARPPALPAPQARGHRRPRAGPERDRGPPRDGLPGGYGRVSQEGQRRCPRTPGTLAADPREAPLAARSPPSATHRPLGAKAAPAGRLTSSQRCDGEPEGRYRCMNARIHGSVCDSYITIYGRLEEEDPMAEVPF